jgi:transcriptional regulator with XRE-family HTH domain
MSAKPRSRYTLAAAALLGQLVAAERKVRRMTALSLAERLGVDRSTVARIEKGDPRVELGTAFEACALLGIPLFESDPAVLAQRLGEAQARLALLPRRARSRQVASDDF